MNKVIRIIIGLIFTALAVGLFMIAIALLPNMNDWGKILTLFVPTVFLGVALLAIGWSVAMGVRSRDIIEDIFFLWR